MLDIEGELIAYLKQVLGLPTYADVPKDRPPRFVTVELTGASEDVHGAINRPSVAVQSWAPTTEEASKLARKVDDAMLSAPYIVQNLFSCERTSLVRFPDPDSRTPRYQGLYALTTT